MHMPTKARSRLLLPLLATITLTFLGACAEATSPLPAPTSGTTTLAPTGRSNSGYVVAEMMVRQIADSTLSATQTSTRKGKP